MISLETALILITWVALFSLPIVVPWAVIQIVVWILEADVEGVIAPWTPSAPSREREQRDTSEVAMTDNKDGDAEVR